MPDEASGSACFDCRYRCGIGLLIGGDATLLAHAFEEAATGDCHLGDGFFEGWLICFGRLVEAANLSNELQRSRA